MFRLILDLRKITSGIENDSFKMETLLNSTKILNKGMWACKIDLSKGYFQIPIHPKSRHLLGFIWNGTIYHFNVLPFGLSSASLIFTKIMKQIVKKWRIQGMIVFIRNIIYSDSTLKGYGAFQDQIVMIGKWNPTEENQSIGKN